MTTCIALILDRLKLTYLANHAFTVNTLKGASWRRGAHWRMGSQRTMIHTAYNQQSAVLSRVFTSVPNISQQNSSSRKRNICNLFLVRVIIFHLSRCEQQQSRRRPPTLNPIGVQIHPSFGICRRSFRFTSPLTQTTRQCFQVGVYVKNTPCTSVRCRWSSWTMWACFTEFPGRATKFTSARLVGED